MNTHYQQNHHFFKLNLQEKEIEIGGKKIKRGAFRRRFGGCGVGREDGPWARVGRRRRRRRRRRRHRRRRW